MRSVCAEPAPAAAEAPATTAVALAPAAAVAAPADTKVEVAKGDRFRVYKAMLDEGECGVHCGTRACVRVAAAPGRAHEEGERREKLARVAAKKKKTLRCLAHVSSPSPLVHRLAQDLVRHRPGQDDQGGHRHDGRTVPAPGERMER